jgi:septum formation protein
MRHKIFLASDSSRRIALLKQVGASFEVVSPGEVELGDSSFPVEFVTSNACLKVMSVTDELADGIVIGADTVIFFESKIYGKPRNVSEARKILNLLKGQTHSVLTGVAVYDVESKKMKKFTEETKVKFRDLNEGEVEKYLLTGEWEGKAGAYAIQGKGALLVESICGCFYNVVGLPLARLYEVLRMNDVKLGF